MLLGISIQERDYCSMSDEERLHLLDEAYFRARQTRLKAEKYAERQTLVGGDVLDERQSALVTALFRGLLD